MKKYVISVIIAALVAVALLVGFIVSIPLVNNASAKNVEKSLVDIELPEKTELVESMSRAEKLVGNGNGMQYFGAILIKSELSLDELTDYYSEKLDGAVVKEQKSQNIEFLHGFVSFESELDENDNYYIVYCFGDGIFPFSELDIRGH